jgi:hypothetical protein
MGCFFAWWPAEEWTWAHMAVRSNPNHLIAASTGSGAHASLAEARAVADRLRTLHLALHALDLGLLILKRPEDLARLAEGLTRDAPSCLISAPSQSRVGG